MKISSLGWPIKRYKFILFTCSTFEQLATEEMVAQIRFNHNNLISTGTGHKNLYFSFILNLAHKSTNKIMWCSMALYSYINKYNLKFMCRRIAQYPICWIQLVWKQTSKRSYWYVEYLHCVAFTFLAFMRKSWKPLNISALLFEKWKRKQYW
jgi:hypothetical protein